MALLCAQERLCYIWVAKFILDKRNEQDCECFLDAAMMDYKFLVEVVVGGEWWKLMRFVVHEPAPTQEQPSSGNILLP